MKEDVVIGKKGDRWIIENRYWMTRKYIAYGNIMNAIKLVEERYNVRLAYMGISENGEYKYTIINSYVKS